MNPMVLLGLCAVVSVGAMAQTASETPRSAARDVRKIALWVQNNAAQDVQVPMQGLTRALETMLCKHRLQVIVPPEPAYDLHPFRAPEPDGVLRASVLELHDTTYGTPPRVHQFTVRLALNLADAQTGATVCGETVETRSPKYTNNQVAQNRARYIGDLLYEAAQECARRLAANPALANWPPPPPPPPPPIFDKLVDRLCGELLTNPQFIKNYEAQKESGGRLPIAIIGGLENESGNVSFDAGLKAAGERFRKKLFDTGLFDVKDDAMLVNFAKRIIASGNSPTENGDLMEALQQHGSPDFYVVGNLNHFADLDGTAYFKFRLSMHSLRTGKIVWEGIDTVAN